MEFAVERAECAADVVDVIATSLCNLETPRQTMTARLYVVSDLLHNCAAPVKGVQAYRALFISALPSVFERLELYLEAAPSSASRRAFKRDVLATLRAWSDWCAFTDDFIIRLRGSAFAVDD
jgi:U2-associated protein SR140